MPYKIPFSVIFVTSEEEGHRSCELTTPCPTTSGWRASKNCTYPQEIIICIKNQAEIQRIQLLAHQYLIPSRVEFYVGENDTEEDINKLQFRYLGFVTLSDNQGTAFQARELKSVTLQCQGKIIKLVLHQNHSNTFNAHDQIGLMAISLLGKWTEDNNNSPNDLNGDMIEDGGSNSNLQSILVHNPQYTSPYDDLAFEMYVDPDAAKIIRQMEIRKQHAVLCERFEYARKLKQAMEELRRAGERLGKFELEKRQAIGMEHFGKAKLKKAQMDEYRAQVYTFLEIDDLLEINGQLSKNDEPMDPTRRRELPPPPRLRPLPRSRDPSPQAASHGTVSTDHHQNGNHHQSQTITNQNGSLIKRKIINNNNSNNNNNNNPMGNSMNKSSYEAYEERAVPALKSSTHRAEELLRDGYDGYDRHTTNGLSEREKRQATLPLTVFGTALVERFYSKQFSDREDGLRLLREELTRPGCNTDAYDHNNPRPSANKIARAAIFLLHKALRDKVFVVYSLAADVIRLFFTQFVPTRRVTPGELTRSVERVLPELLSKSGDPTPRIHNMALQIILDIAECPDVRDLFIIPMHLTRSLTNTTHPRLALSKMEIVEQLIIKNGISTNKQSGLTCRGLTEFGSSGLHHPSEPVRKVAERVLLLIYKVNPRLVRKSLPPDDEITRRNLLYRHLFTEFDRIDIQRKREMILEQQEQDIRDAEMAREADLAREAELSREAEIARAINKINAAQKQETIDEVDEMLIEKITIKELKQKSTKVPDATTKQKPIKPSCIPVRTSRIPRAIRPSATTPSPAHTSSSSSSTSAMTSPGMDHFSNNNNNYGGGTPQSESCRMCIFCHKRDVAFTDEGLNIHYWRTCPLLIRCQNCKQVMEVAAYNKHLLWNCELRHNYKECQRCREPVPVKEFYQHIKSSNCLLAEPPTKAGRCPFCHKNTSPSEKAWRDHLAGPNPCPAHPRRKYFARATSSRPKSPLDAIKQRRSPGTPRIPRRAFR